MPTQTYVKQLEVKLIVNHCSCPVRNSEFFFSGLEWELEKEKVLLIREKVKIQNISGNI